MWGTEHSSTIEDMESMLSTRQRPRILYYRDPMAIKKKGENGQNKGENGRCALRPRGGDDIYSQISNEQLDSLFFPI